MVRRRVSRRSSFLLRLVALVPLLALLGIPLQAQAASTGYPTTGTYHNPLKPRIPGDGRVESCADPTVFRGHGSDHYWYMFCTSDPLNDNDKNASGQFNFHHIPMNKSLDLVHWTYVGDAFANVPSWGEPTAGMWAPEVVYSTTYHKYYLFFVVTDVKDAVSGEANCGGDNAIGMATSDSPTGPWTASSGPVVGPRRAGPGCNFF